MKTVDQMIADIIRREGGYVDDKNDNGGATNHGVSLRYAKGKPELDLNGDGVIDAKDIRLVTPEIAAELYKQDFFVQPNIHRLPLKLQPQVFDMSVNAGAKRAVILLQNTISQLGIRINIDGAIGPVTIRLAEQAIARFGFKRVNNGYVTNRIAFYERLVANDAKQGRFLKGWKNRANEFRL
ncbi:glycoside hydrolase family 108 protein [Aureimonas sp. AU40]|uniref:glycoside hydrolase family 108 protein n=1 Tax=Aureimonas sp. AU40 TaxID=1637747 RepID=UPI0009EA40CB|nr:N-acetylmuramidase [Aureimonas sp. AU40]